METKIDPELLLEDIDMLIAHISAVLYKNIDPEAFHYSEIETIPSAVLLLLSSTSGNGSGPCIILNKRSEKVKQPGDLCCPGGSISPVLDAGISKFLLKSGLLLNGWTYWASMMKNQAEDAQHLALLFTTAVREALEEMRLNPFGIRFLGPLPPTHLVMFKRLIYPMTAWVGSQKKFFPNWEVDKMIYIPLRMLMDSKNYARYELHFENSDMDVKEFPCFVFEQSNGNELLWGATYRIVMTFLKLVFKFIPPDMNMLRSISGVLRQDYTQSSR